MEWLLAGVFMSSFFSERFQVPKVSLQKRKLEVDFDLDPRTGIRHKRGRHHNHRGVAAGGGGTSGPTSLTSSWPSPFSKLPAIGSVGESWDFVETKRAPLTERQEKLLRLRLTVKVLQLH